MGLAQPFLGRLLRSLCANVFNGNLARLPVALSVEAQTCAIKLDPMSATELLQKIEELPETERRWLLGKLSELGDADLPESLRQSLAEAARGEFIELDDALQELDRP